MINIEELIEAARVHRNNLLADINNASTRLEHVRLTALAQEAENLLTKLEDFYHGMVYSKPLDITATELSGLELEG